MNVTSWMELEPREQDAFWSAVEFLKGRLSKPNTVEWGLDKATHSKILRAAVIHSLNSDEGKKLLEPWKSSWRLIEEFWREPATEGRHGIGEHLAQSRLNAGELSGSIIQDIVDLVAPRLHLENHSRYYSDSKRRKAKRASDLFSIRLASGRSVDLNTIKLSEIASQSFIHSLSTSLVAAVTRGLDIAKRTGWDGGIELWRLGQLNRVYSATVVTEDGRNTEPDEFHEGIAPSVKLLYASVERLLDLDASSARELANGWGNSTSPVFVRLWAALARNHRFASPNEVAGFLLNLTDKVFWRVQYFPEIAEVRARRFRDLSEVDQIAISDRIKAMPPRSVWPHLPLGETFKKEQLLSTIQELSRIEAADGQLDPGTKMWLEDKRKNVKAHDTSIRVESGFPVAHEVQRLEKNPDTQFDLLDGERRLDALASAFVAPRISWDSDPAESAAAWLRQPDSVERILRDLESSKESRRGSAQLWERLGWAHSPQSIGADHDLAGEAERVLILLEALPDETLDRAIEGIAHWLSSWEHQVIASKRGRAAWTRIWPFAVRATNARRSADGQSDLSTTGSQIGDAAPLNLDTLNTPAGKLVGVFLSGCPKLKKSSRPFASGTALRSMRDLIMNATGRSKLIGQYRLIEALRYFLNADRRWATKTLIPPLLRRDSEAKILWRAVARSFQFVDVVKVLGKEMLRRSVDFDIDRESRQMFAMDLVIECLQSSLELRKPVVEGGAVQQMLRSVEDEVRANVAGVLTRFVNDVSSAKNSTHSARDVFVSAVAPFLRVIWPQEYSLATPGVSKAFAVLPAASKEAFAIAVDTVNRFLVPFDAWSMIDYGLYGESEGKQKILIVDDAVKARAFLLLLDKTISPEERGVVPHELGVALSHIQALSPELSGFSSFRRLASLARR